SCRSPNMIPSVNADCAPTPFSLPPRKPPPIPRCARATRFYPAAQNAPPTWDADLPQNPARETHLPPDKPADVPHLPGSRDGFPASHHARAHACRSPRLPPTVDVALAVTAPAPATRDAAPQIAPPRAA